MHKQFLQTLFRNAEAQDWFELRLLGPGLPPRRSFTPIGVLRSNGWKLPPQPENFNIYFGVIPRVREGSGGDDCSEALAVWADYDNPDTMPTFPLRPSLVVSTSTNKYQCYWLLDKACGDLGLIESINHAIALQSGADANCCDRARILRLPGYLNLKYETRPVVELLRNQASMTYSIEDLRTAWPEVQPLWSYQRRRRDSSIEAPEWVGQTYDRIIEHLEALNYRGTPSPSGDMWFRCCFHDEDEPSLSIHPDRGFRCWGCKIDERISGRLSALAYELGLRVI